MSTLRIKDAPLLPNVDGSEKIPTGGKGDFSVTLDQVKTFARGGLPQQLEDHINDLENPHNVTKDQVGLGNADNTSDIDKPVSNATQEALNIKADKTYVDEQDNLKVDKSEKGVSGGLATLDEYGKVPRIELPSFVDLDSTVPTYKTVADGVDTVIGVADGAYFNVRSSSNESYADEYQNISGSAVATGKSYPSSSYVEAIAEYIALPFNQGKTYGLNERVQLDNGDIVKSNIPSNTSNPNTDMLGWVKVNDASQIFDASGRTQQQVNDDLRSSIRKKLSSFGAIPDDPSKAIQNTSALISASRAGVVIFDGDYQFDVTGSTNDFDTSIQWVADIAGGSAHFKGTISNFIRFGSVDHVIVDGVKITSDDQTGVLMTLKDNLAVINKLKFSNHNKTGIGVFRGTWSNTVNPEVQWYGVKEIDFSNCVVENTNSTFQLINCPFNKATFFDTTGKNISYCPFNLGIDNTHTYATNVEKLQKRLECDRFVSINDDSFWATADTGGYLTLLIFEGAYASIKNSHVEGLKTTSNTAVYDFYINSTEYVNEGNTWKNNICFNSSKLNNELIKAKESPVSSHKLNTYIVEEDFVLRHATDVKSQGWVTLFAKTFATDKSSAIIRNNKFDVYMLLGMSAATFTKNIELCDNEMNIGIFASNMLNIYNSVTGISTYADADVLFKGNKIRIKKTAEIVRNGVTYSTATMLRMSYNSANTTYRQIELENDIEVESVEILTYLYDNQIYASELILNDKMNFTGATESFNRLVGAGTYKSLAYPLKSKITSRTPSNLYSGALFSGLNLTTGGVQEIDLNYKFENLVTYIAKPQVGTKTVFVEITAVQNGVIRSAMYKVLLESDGFTYQNLAGTYTKFSYPASITSYNPIVDVVNKLDTLMSGVRFVLSTSDSDFFQVRYEFTGSVANTDTNLIAKIKVV